MKVRRQDRIPIGTYNKWIAHGIRFVLKIYLPKGTTLLFRGRGKRRINGIVYDQDLPLKHAKKVAIYVIKTFYEHVQSEDRPVRAPLPAYKRISGHLPEPAALVPEWEETNNLENIND